MKKMMTKKTKPLISIVVPCYNEEEGIEEAIKRLTQLALSIKQFDTEIIFVDDGSHDHTRHLIKVSVNKDTRIKLIGLARNFGHQIAVTAGIDAAQGDAVILIDADLQDPPEVILNMIAKWQEGFDVVYGVRSMREGESSFKLLTAGIFYRLLNRLSDIPIPLDTGDFRLMSRPVVNALKAMRERDRFVRGMVSWVGFKQVAMPYKRSKRFAGKSKYPLRKMLNFALDGILSFSIKPLQMSVVMGILFSCASFAGIFYVLYQRLFTNIWVEGWTALMIVLLLIGGLLLISLGIIGEYIGRIYNEVKQRPLYITDESIGLKEEKFSASKNGR
jgi:polyisoprenyl-phosphate glycosyltransferase